MSIDDIKAFIASEERRLQDKFAADLSHVSILIASGGVRLWAYGTRGPQRYKFQCGEGATTDEAAEKWIAEHVPAPAIQASRLRDQARELLRAAADLEKEGAR